MRTVTAMDETLPARSGFARWAESYARPGACARRARQVPGDGTAAQATAAVGHACWELGHDADEAPMSDGGEGLLDVLGGANRCSIVTGPLGAPVEAGWRLAQTFRGDRDGAGQWVDACRRPGGERSAHRLDDRHRPAHRPGARTGGPPGRRRARRFGHHRRRPRRARSPAQPDPPARRRPPGRVRRPDDVRRCGGGVRPAEGGDAGPGRAALRPPRRSRRALPLRVRRRRPRAAGLGCGGRIGGRARRHRRPPRCPASTLWPSTSRSTSGWSPPTWSSPARGTSMPRASMARSWAAWSAGRRGRSSDGRDRRRRRCGRRRPPRWRRDSDVACGSIRRALARSPNRGGASSTPRPRPRADSGSRSAGRRGRRAGDRWRRHRCRVELGQRLARGVGAEHHEHGGVAEVAAGDRGLGGHRAGPAARPSRWQGTRRSPGLLHRCARRRRPSCPCWPSVESVASPSV